MYYFMTKSFLDKIYKSNFKTSSKNLYDKWAPFYDKELTDNQYVTPLRCAEVLSNFAKNKEIKILDVGCGTGLAGFSLRKFGFKNIDGLDLSKQMLRIASDKKIYRMLFNLNLNNLSNFEKGYDAIIAAGVISPSHADPETISNSYSILNKKGLMIFSINDHALNNTLFFSEIKKVIKRSNFILLDQIYGDHIKELSLKSSIFVLQKLE